MNIGTAASRSGLPAKTIRYYEDIGLIAPDRSTNGYRDFDAGDVHKLRFLKRARGLGFTVSECRLLLALYEDDARASADVKRIATAKVEEIDKKIKELKDLRKTLSHLAKHCHGDDRPECPILDELSNTGGDQ